MIRAMWTAATGMTAQQLNVDTIAHNLANVNTNAFKRSRAEFADLLYQIQRLPGTTRRTSASFPSVYRSAPVCDRSRWPRNGFKGICDRPVTIWIWPSMAPDFSR